MNKDIKRVKTSILFDRIFLIIFIVIMIFCLGGSIVVSKTNIIKSGMFIVLGIYLFIISLHYFTHIELGKIKLILMEEKK